MKILVACEESQTVTIELRRLGRTAKIRSKTFTGIARAMAEQWAGPAEAVLKGGEG